MRAALTLAVALVLLCPSARADMEACAVTLEHARELRAQGKVKDAVAAMDACTDCEALADVCASTRAALRSALAKLTLTVHDCDGNPLPDATLLVDGDVVAQGKPIELDPGPHDGRAELSGRVEEQTIVVAEHETRRASLLLSGVRRSRPVPASAIAVGAFSAVAFATAAGLWAWAQNPPSDGSAPTEARAFAPPLADRSAPNDLLVAAGVTLSAAITGAIVAVVLYAVRP